MKPQAPHPHHPLPGLRPLLMGLILSLASLTLHAQEPLSPPQAEGGQVTGEAAAPNPSPDGAIIIPHAQFHNATLGEVVEYLAEKSGANLMMPAEAKAMPVPDMNLRQVTSMGVLRAIREMGVPFQVSETPPQTAGELPLWVIVPNVVVQEPQTNLTRIFNLRGARIPPGDPAAEVTSEMFKKLVGEISEAINIALQAREEATRGEVSYPVLKVHEGTRLMVISGNPQEVDIAQQVICALGGIPVN